MFMGSSRIIVLLAATLVYWFVVLIWLVGPRKPLVEGRRRLSRKAVEELLAARPDDAVPESPEVVDLTGSLDLRRIAFILLGPPMLLAIAVWLVF
jgi:hypothetical protein